MRVTFDELLQKKLRNDARKEETFEIEVFDGKTMLFRRPSEGRLFEIIDSFESCNTTKKADELICQIIYECCQELHDSQLHQKLGIDDPDDIVPALFSYEERTSIGEKLTKEFQIASNEGIDAVKN